MIHTQPAKNKVGVGVGIVKYEDENGLEFLSVENAHANATIALQGGHVMHIQFYGFLAIRAIQKVDRFVGGFLFAGLGSVHTQLIVVIAHTVLPE